MLTTHEPLSKDSWRRLHDEDFNNLHVWIKEIVPQHHNDRFQFIALGDESGFDSPCLYDWLEHYCEETFDFKSNSKHDSFILKRNDAMRFVLTWGKSTEDPPPEFVLF